MKAKKVYPIRFRDQWLSDDRYKDWLKKVEGESKKSYCSYCKCFLLAKICDIEKHRTTKKHRKAAEPWSAQRLSRHEDENMSQYTLRIVGDEDDDDGEWNCEQQLDYIYGHKRKNSNDTFVPVQPHEGVSSPTPSSRELIIPASIGFIGCGNMAQALMNAFLAKGLADPHLMMASAPSHRNLSKLPSGVQTTTDNNKVVRECDVIYICVKPHLLSEMIEGLDPLEREHNPLFVSVVTGFNLITLEQLLGSLVDAPRVVRTMPNTPCMIGQGCCVYTMGNNTNDGDSQVVQSMLHAVGFCAKVPEYQIDAVCGLAGSGPAYIYAAIEALSDGGVKMGLPRQLAQTLAAHMVRGAASMVLESGKHPGHLKDEVCSPAGTTITAMHSLEKNGFRNALISAVEASANRSKELGKQD